ncbi:hypothetical protein TBK1r_03670 [Stieleria magnilauensis]|uniref:Uncharacterized protein n=1 Tax=Stieleria magnilauensis TaxID=2527963 RepID=A0ABX5XHI6_9BACT|nr:hypothetical protein TBK1r_03670 [Planctomycetes bacterium TBK1r]
MTVAVSMVLPRHRRRQHRVLPIPVPSHPAPSTLWRERGDVEVARSGYRSTQVDPLAELLTAAWIKFIPLSPSCTLAYLLPSQLKGLPSL